MKAFPTTAENNMQYGDTGMDLRDYIAIAYMNGIVSNPNLVTGASLDKIAKNGYEMADAMMQARVEK